MPPLELLEEAIAGISAGPVGEAAFEVVAQDLDEDYTRELPITSPQGETLKLTVGAGAGVKINAFNSEDDEDEDGVLARPDRDDPDGDGRLAPQINLATDRAWLKYRAEAGIRGSAGGRVANFGFRIAGDRKLVLADYRIKGRSRGTLEEVLSDLKSPRFALSLDDVQELEPREALSMQVQGTLSASVTLSWHEVLTTEISRLGELLGSNQTLAIDMRPGASVTVNVGRDDDFILAFSRTGHADRPYRVAVKKARARRLAAAARTGVRAELADPEAATAVLTDVLDGLFDTGWSRIEALLEKDDATDLTEAEAEALAKAADGLGIQEVGQKALDAVKERLEGFVDDVKERIEEAARTKAEVSFTYEYERTSTNMTLLQARLSGARLSEFHGALIRGDLTGLIAHLRDHEEGLENFLRRDTLVVERAWGFTLGFGEWSLTGIERRAAERVVTRDRRGHQKIAFLGAGSYEALGDTWGADLRADMPRFSSAPEATLNEFRYGLNLSITWDGTLTRRALSEQLDTALLWRAVAAADLRRVQETIWEGARGSRVEFVTGLTAGEGVIEPIFEELVEDDPPVVSGSLAAAMPWMEDFPSRRRPALRRGLYQRAWKRYLLDPDQDENGLSRAAESDLRNAALQFDDARSLAKREQLFREGIGGGGAFGNFRHSFTGMLAKHPKTASRWTSLRRGARDLVAAMAGAGTHWTRFHGIYESMVGFWTQSFLVRALGVHLLEIAHRRGLAAELKVALGVRQTGGAGNAWAFATGTGESDSSVPGGA